MLLSQEDDVGQRKKTDEPTADDDVDEQEDEEQQEQDTEQTSSEPDVQQTNQSSPRKRTKADLEVSTSMIQYDTIEEFLTWTRKLSIRLYLAHVARKETKRNNASAPLIQ